MTSLPRGITPELLLSQVKNTAPWVLEQAWSPTELNSLPPLLVLKDFERSIGSDGQGRALSHFEYFQLCLSAHYVTCATPVPTDVDNQIRKKLWPQELPVEVALEMATWVLEAHSWDYRPVSARFSFGAKNTAWEKESLDGHLGEWFTVACGAYCSLKQWDTPESQMKRAELFDAIRDETNRHSEVFGSLWRAGDGIGCLLASVSIAHNFGDLDRVMDQWELAVDDPLRLEFYKLGSQPLLSNGKLRHQGRLWSAGELYKSPIDGSSMTAENHRHFALRKPRIIRSQAEFLVPMGPFFDSWGATLGQKAPPEGQAEIVEALNQGWQRLPGTLGYGRALLGLHLSNPEVQLPEFKKGHPYRKLLQTSREDFEANWAKKALLELDEIPSRMP